MAAALLRAAPRCAGRLLLGPLRASLPWAAPGTRPARPVRAGPPWATTAAAKPPPPPPPLLPAGRGPLLDSITPLLPGVLHQQVRTVIQYSLRKGKRKTVKAVVHRFLRLHCGLWLRRRAGYKKRLWKKTPRRRQRLREQVFCNKTQSKLLDKMTTSFWKRRNWYANDPFQKYHDRTNLQL